MNEHNFTHNKFYLLQYVRKNDYFLEKMGEEVKNDWMVCEWEYFIIS